MSIFITGTAYNATTVVQKKYVLAKQVDSSLWQSENIAHAADNAVSAEHCAIYCRITSFQAYGDGLCELFFFDPATDKCHLGNRGKTMHGPGPGSGRHDVYFDPSKLKLWGRIQ